MISMCKVKKIHTIIFFFILIFILGIYSFTLYIDNTIDQKTEPAEHTEMDKSIPPKREATEIN